MDKKISRIAAVVFFFLLVETLFAPDGINFQYWEYKWLWSNDRAYPEVLWDLLIIQYILTFLSAVLFYFLSKSFTAIQYISFAKHILTALKKPLTKKIAIAIIAIYLTFIFIKPVVDDPYELKRNLSSFTPAQEWFPDSIRYAISNRPQILNRISAYKQKYDIYNLTSLGARYLVMKDIQTYGEDILNMPINKYKYQELRVARKFGNAVEEEIKEQQYYNIGFDKNTGAFYSNFKLVDALDRTSKFYSSLQGMVEKYNKENDDKLPTQDFMAFDNPDGVPFYNYITGAAIKGYLDKLPKDIRHKFSKYAEGEFEKNINKKESLSPYLLARLVNRFLEVLSKVLPATMPSVLPDDDEQRLLKSIEQNRRILDGYL